MDWTKYKKIFEKIPLAFGLHKIIVDNNGKATDYIFLDLNDKFEEYTGLDRSKLLGKRISEAIPQTLEDPFDWIGFYGKVALNDGYEKFNQFSTALGKWYQIEVFSPEKYYFVTIFSSIDVDKADVKYKESFELSSNLLLLCDSFGKIYQTNTKSTQEFMSLETDIIGKDIFSFIGNSLNSEINYSLDDLTRLQQINNYITKFKTSNNIYRDIRWNLKLHNGVIFVSGIDITEELKMKLKRNFVNEKFQKIFYNNPTVLTINTVPDARIIDVNKQFIDTTGFSPEEAYGKNVFELGLIRDIEKLGMFDAEMKSRGSVKNFEMFVYTKDDEQLNGIVSGETISIKGEDFYMVSVLDVTKEKKNLQKLEEKTKLANQFAKKALHASKIKSQFISNMSHEIRTPINGIIGFTDLMLSSALDKTQEEYMGNIKSSADSLLSIVNDILDLSKIEAGKMSLNIEKTDIHLLLQDISKLFKLLAITKGIDLIIDIDLNLPNMIYLDAVRFKQILINLISNSIKFTSSGYIKLTLKYAVEEGNHRLLVSVFDTGIGIQEENKEKLFKAFSQADTTMTRKFGGTGLGLIISNSLVKEMGGEITFTSQPNLATTFNFGINIKVDEIESISNPLLARTRVLLSLKSSEISKLLTEKLTCWGYTCLTKDDCFSCQEEEIYNIGLIITDASWVRSRIDDKYERVLLNIPTVLLYDTNTRANVNDLALSRPNCYMLEKPVLMLELVKILNQIHLSNESKQVVSQVTEHKDKAKSKYGIISQKNIKILIAEDNRLNMLLVTTILKKLLPNSSINEAQNGNIAYNMALETDYDIVLMDLQMPEMDGFNATRMILSHKAVNPPIIVALTANVTQEDMNKSFECGMKDFIAKPIDKSVLIEKLQINLKL
jgi:PAS domain S-box-containing protein